MPRYVESPAEMLCFSLYAADHAMGRVYRSLLEPYGLTYPQYIVLMELADQTLTLRALGEAVGLESNTLTPLLKRMQAGGLVERRRNPDDERALMVSLTDKGRALREDTKSIQACVFKATGLPLAELAALRDRIEQLRGNLQRSMDSEKMPQQSLLT